MPATTRLITIPFSHFCEKARWGLDRAGIAYVEEEYLPFFHLAGTALRGRGRTTPIWIDEHGHRVGDSTDILLALDARMRADLRLHHDRDDALALEELFDRKIGPAVRRLAYHHLIGERPVFVKTLTTRGPAWQKRAVRSAPGFFARGLDRALDLSRTAAERSERSLDDALREVERRTDGTRWLVGDRFGVADLTLASLLSPMLAPPEHPFPYGTDADAPPALRAIRARIRDSAAGALALRAYREERRRA